MRIQIGVLLLVTLTGCAGTGIGANLGRERSITASDIVYAQRLVELYGEAGAITRLQTAKGWKAERAAALVLDAVASRGIVPTAVPEEEK